MPHRASRRDWIRPSATRSTVALWAKSLLNALLFFALFMGALPWVVHRLLPLALPLPERPRAWVAGALFAIGVIAWIACLDVFSRRGRGTPLPFDAPSQLVTTGLFGAIRNPIMAAELLVIWSEAIYLSSLGVALYAAAVTVLAHLLVVRVEEPELRERFGERYGAYCREVPRWLPGHGRRSTGARDSSDE